MSPQQLFWKVFAGLRENAAAQWAAKVLCYASSALRCLALLSSLGRNPDRRFRAECVPAQSLAAVNYCELRFHMICTACAQAEEELLGNNGEDVETNCVN